MNIFAIGWIAMATVAKVLLVAVAGIITSGYLKDKASLKGFSHITIFIFLPSLLVTRIIKGVTLDTLGSFYWATLLGLVPLTLGFLFSVVAGRFVAPELHGLLRLACTFQNALSFALSITMSLHGLSWYTTEDDVNEAQTYLFLYNLFPSMSLWAIGTRIVQRGKAAEIAANAPPGSPATADVVGSPTGPTTPPSPATPTASLPARIKAELAPLATPPLLASFIGLAISLTPLREVVLSPPFDIAFGGLEVIGQGTVPLTLFVLGCNLVGSDSSVELPKRFYAAVIFVRLMLIPAVIFGLLHVMTTAGIIPDSRIFKLVMLVESMAPTAVNASLLCAKYSYRVKEYTRMVFVVYVATIFTTTFWLSLVVWYLGQ